MCRRNPARVWALELRLGVQGLGFRVQACRVWDVEASGCKHVIFGTTTIGMIQPPATKTRTL